MKSLSSRRNEKGQGLVEYSMIIVLVSIVVISSLMVLEPIVGGVFSDVKNSVTDVTYSGGGTELNSNSYLIHPELSGGGCHSGEILSDGNCWVP